MKALKVACLIGDYYHVPAPVESMLRSSLAVVGAEGAFFSDPETFPWRGLGAYDLVIIAKDARAKPDVSEARWSGEANEGPLAAYVKGGGRLFALHNGLACYDPSGTFSRLVRGRFLFHPPEHPRFVVRSVDEKLPFNGQPPFEIVDEMYFVYIDSAKTEVLLQTYSPDYGSSAAAWRHHDGKGGVFCFTPGHNERVLANPAYHKIVIGGLQWLLNS